MLIFLGVALAFVFLGYVITYIPIKEEVVEQRPFKIGDKEEVVEQRPFKIGDKVEIHIPNLSYPKGVIIAQIGITNMYCVAVYKRGREHHIWAVDQKLKKEREIYLGGE